MKDILPLINRKNELSFVSNLIENRRGELDLLCISGEGGIGKTRLLIEIDQKLRKQISRSNIAASGIIDFDDPTYHVAENLGIKLAKRLDEKIFSQFLKDMIYYRKLEVDGASHERLSQEFERGTETFVQCFNNLSKNKRVIILLDTTEKIIGSDYFDYIVETFSKLQNALIIISGRNSNDLYNSLILDDDVSAHHINLQPLLEKDGEEYLLNKQKSKHIKIDKDISQILLLLSKGKPIIIDLAVEWQTRDIPLDWMLEYSVNDLKEFHTNTLNKIMKIFERKLVSHLINPRDNKERLILWMSHFFPLNVRKISSLLSISLPDATELYEEMKSFIFVKTLPYERIQLHDEMQRMVIDYVWPEYDPDGGRRRYNSSIAVSYLREEIELVEKRIEELNEEEKDLFLNSNHEKELNVFSEKTALEHDLWMLRLEYLKHNLLLNIRDGVKLFCALFDTATKDNRLNYRELLMVFIQEYTEEMNFNEKFEINHRRITNWIYKGDYHHAVDIAKSMIESQKLSNVQNVEMLIQKGNLEIRIGNLNAGMEDFQKAIQTCENKLNLNDQTVKPYLMRARHALGWGFRKIGNYFDAIQEYEKALDLSVQVDNRLEEAWILNDLSVAYTRMGNSSGAMRLAGQAKNLWDDLENMEGLGAIYHAFADIYLTQENFDACISNSNISLDIFEEIGSLEWINRAYFVLGKCHLRRADKMIMNEAIIENKTYILDDLNLAEKYMHKVNKFTGRLYVNSFHYLGHISFDTAIVHNKKDFRRSEKYFLDGYNESKKASLNDIQLNCLSDIALIALKHRDFDKFHFIKEEYDNYLKIWGDKWYPKDVEGILLKYFGDFYLLTGATTIDEAISYYEKGFLLLSQYEFLDTFSLTAQLISVEQLTGELNDKKSILTMLGERLYSSWQNNPEISRKHPEAKRYFMHWRRGETNNV